MSDFRAMQLDILLRSARREERMRVLELLTRLIAGLTEKTDDSAAVIEGVGAWIDTIAKGTMKASRADEFIAKTIYNHGGGEA